MELQLLAPMLPLAHWGEPNELFGLHADTLEFLPLGRFNTVAEMAKCQCNSKNLLFTIDRPGIDRLLQFIDSKRRLHPGLMPFFWYLRSKHQFGYLGHYQDHATAVDAHRAQYEGVEVLLFTAEIVDHWRFHASRCSPTIH